MIDDNPTKEKEDLHCSAKMLLSRHGIAQSRPYKGVGDARQFRMFLDHCDACSDTTVENEE